MKKILTFGVFDFYHLGHLRLFKHIKEKVGEACYLIVAMQDGDYIVSQKPDANVLYSTSERREMLESNKYIDEVVEYTLADDFIGKMDFDIYARGEDQTSERIIAFESWCRNNGKEVLVMPRTQGIASSDIKREINHDRKELTIISDEDISKLAIDRKETMKWIKDSFMLQSKATFMHTSFKWGAQNQNFYNTLPCIVKDGNNIKDFSVKVVNRYVGHEHAVDGDIYLYDTENGKLQALVDAYWITAARTGASGVLATQLLAKPNFKTVAVMGLGAVGIAYLECLFSYFSDQNITIKLLNYKDHATKVVDKYKYQNNIKFKIVENTEDLIRGSDVVVSAITSATEQYSKPEWFNNDVVLLPLHTRGFENCDNVFETIVLADINRLNEYKNREEFQSVYELSDFISGKSRPEGRVLCYNMGMAIHDMVFARKIIELHAKKS